MKKSLLHENTVGLCLSVFLTVVTSAPASVFDDCLWSFRGPVDRDGDGVAKTGEIVDVIGGGQASSAVNQAVVYGNTHNAAGETADTGISSGITVRKETVSNFIRSFESPCLYFQNCVRESDSCVCPLGVKLTALTTDWSFDKGFTAVFRIRRDTSSLSTSAWLAYLGGLGIGFGSSSSANASLKLNISSTDTELVDDQGSKLQIPADHWVDVAIIRDSSGFRAVVQKEDMSSQTSVSVPGDASLPVCGGSDENKPWLIANPSPWTSWRSPNAVATVGVRKNFYNGSVQQIAFWDRALSKEEIAEAFGNCDYQSSWQIGVRNGRSDEFGAEAGSVATDAKGVWRNLPPEMAVGDVWALTFDLPPYATSLARILEAAKADGSASAKISVSVNGKDCGVLDFSASSVAELRIAGEAFESDSNTIILQRVDAETSAFKLDTIRCFGSWQAGSNYSDFAQETKVKSEVSAVDTNFMHWSRAVVPDGQNTLTIDFPIDVKLAETHKFMFSTGIQDQNSKHLRLDVYVNDELVYTRTDNNEKNRWSTAEPSDIVKIPLGYGALKQRDNKIMFKASYDGATAEDPGVGYYRFFWHRMEVGRRKTGMVLMVR